MKVVVVMMIVMVLMLCSASPTSAQLPQLNYKISSCLKQLNDCYTNSVNFTKIAESSSPPGEIEVPCCSEWAEQIKDNTKCFCNAFSSDLSALSQTFNACNINVSTKTICQGISNTGIANKIAYSVGLLPILLFILTIIVKP